MNMFGVACRHHEPGDVRNSRSEDQQEVGGTTDHHERTEGASMTFTLAAAVADVTGFMLQLDSKLMCEQLAEHILDAPHSVAGVAAVLVA